MVDVIDRRLTLMVNTFVDPVYPELLAVCVALLVAAARLRESMSTPGSAIAGRRARDGSGALSGVLVGTVANDSGSRPVGDRHDLPRGLRGLFLGRPGTGREPECRP